MAPRAAALLPLAIGAGTLWALWATRARQAPSDLTWSPAGNGASNCGFFCHVEWNARSITTVVLTFLASVLASAAGVGGGGFLVPLFNLSLGLPLKSAMALSQAAITGGAVAAGAIAMFQTHPLDDSQPLLDLEVALVLLPCLLLGSTLGVTLNQMFPDWLLVIILTLLLVLLSLRTLRSGLRLRAAELRSEAENEQEQVLICARSELPLLGSKARGSLDSAASRARAGPGPGGGGRDPEAGAAGSSGAQGLLLSEALLSSHPVQMESSAPSSLASSPTSEAAARASFDQALQAEEQQRGQKAGAEPGQPGAVRGHSWGEADGGGGDGGFTFRSPFLEPRSQAPAARWRAHLGQSLRLALLAAFWAAFLGLQLAKDRFPACSRGYFAIMGGQAALSLLSSALLIGQWSCCGARASRTVDASLLAARPQAPPARLALAAAAVLAGGAIAALCGLGGGMVLGPMMLELGLHPLATASTALALVGASASSTTVEFALAGRLPHGWAVVMGGVCAVAGVAGAGAGRRLVQASGRASALVFLIVAIMAAGGILTAVFGGLRAADSLEHGGRIGFISICEP